MRDDARANDGTARETGRTDRTRRPGGTVGATGAGWNARLDGLAIGASVLCMLHCLALPLVLAALPAIAAQLGGGEGFHAAVLILALPTSAWALIGGWRRHRAVLPLMIGAAGLMLMAAGVALAVPAALETGVTVLGSLMLAGAHIGNWRARRAHAAACAAG